MSKVTGKTLVDWGIPSGRWFPEAIRVANALLREGAPEDVVRDRVREMVPPPPETVHPRSAPAPLSVFLDATTDDEVANKSASVRAMLSVLETPTIAAGALMPDACPQGGADGVIPVGGVVAAENAIHPAFHSSDACCSMAISILKRGDDPKRVLDAVQLETHFGPGGRERRVQMPRSLSLDFSNRFLSGLEIQAASHFATQGDGNHFAFVGTLESTGQLAIVTHHGSRGLGASVYKRGMEVARKHAATVAPWLSPYCAWIPADSKAGEEYWRALQDVRLWTRENHFAIHRLVADRIGNRIHYQWWNEHNFVFQKSDGLFYHGKGATPSWSGYSPDDCGLTLIPMNMAEPILITSHTDNKAALGFAPHGAGRNLGRKAFLRRGIPRKPQEVDARFFLGCADPSEFPEAYKSAAEVRSQIDKYNLAVIEDKVLPYGCVMAGERPGQDKRRKRDKRSAIRSSLADSGAPEAAEET